MEIGNGISIPEEEYKRYEELLAKKRGITGKVPAGKFYRTEKGGVALVPENFHSPISAGIMRGLREARVR